MKAVSTTLPSNTDNNLAIKAYPQGVYTLADTSDYIIWTIGALAVFLLVFSLIFISKLMGI